MSLEPPSALISIVFTATRAILAIILLIAGIPKLVAGKGLSTTLRALGVERRRAVVALRIGVPIVETALGVWLLSGLYPAASSFTAAAIFGAFTCVLVRLRKRGTAGCACFLWDDGSVELAQVVRNLILVTIATAIGTVTAFGWYTSGPVWKLQTQTTLVVSAAVLFVFVLYALVVKSIQLARHSITDS